MVKIGREKSDCSRSWEKRQRRLSLGRVKGTSFLVPNTGISSVPNAFVPVHILH